MNIGLLFFAAFAIASANAFLPSEEGCLIRLQDGHERVILESEKWLYLSNGTRFVDITGTDHLGKGLVKRALPEPIKYPQIRMSEQVSPLLNEVNNQRLTYSVYALSSYHDRYYKTCSGKWASNLIYNWLQDIAGQNQYVSVERFSHRWTQQTIVARIKGMTDSTAIAVLGCHLDSVNVWLPTIRAAPGADDDASGVAALIEVFRILVRHGYAPNNTVEFHFYAAEEAGLLGSRALFAEYESKGKNVTSMVQFDMLGYTKRTLEASRPAAISFVTDYVSLELTNYLKGIVDHYCDIPWVDTRCGYACSDHATATESGYPAAAVVEAPFEFLNPTIHTEDDTISLIDFNHLSKFVKFALAATYELGYTD